MDAAAGADTPADFRGILLECRVSLTKASFEDKRASATAAPKRSEGKRADEDGSGAWRNRDTSLSGTVDGTAASSESLLERRRFTKALTARLPW